MRAVLLGMLLFLMFGCSREKEYHVRNCSDVWNGSFQNMANGEVDTKITREGNFQFEHFKDGSKSKFKVEWLDSCRYRLTYLSGNEISQKKVREGNLKTVIIQITEVKEGSYTILAGVEGNPLTYKSELFRIAR
jgi:hypothetical protein